MSAEYQKLTYMSLLRNAEPFLSLDISVVSTGYVLWNGKELQYGAFKITETDSRKRRMQFADFLTDLLRGTNIKYAVIEDVIGGCNFKTTRILTELNIMLEMLIDFGRVPDFPVYRKDNKVWKKELNALNQDEKGIRGENDKEVIRNVLYSLDFRPVAPQDVYDAMGIALAYIYSKTVVKSENTVEKIKALKTDLSKGYKKTQYKTREEMLEAAERSLKRTKKFKGVVEIVYDNGQYSNLLKQFKAVVEEKGDDYIFCICTPLNKIGNIFVTANFDLSDDYVYFTAKL